jgi:iron complex outermembrane receptor protein
VALGFTIRPVDFNTQLAGPNDVWAPFKATYKYHKVLPNVGFTYAVNESLSLFSSYAKGFSAPRTDNLYRAPVVDVTPETTDSFDLGARYITGRLQAQGTLWKINYKNRIVTSFDPATNISVDRNVGKAKSWGFDGQVGFKPIPEVNLIGNVSYIDAKLKNDIIITSVQYNVATPTALTAFQYFCSPLPNTGTAPVQVCGKTKGKFVVETPRWKVGGRAELNINPVTLGVQAMHVGDRWATDVNDVKVNGYTTVDVDARVSLDSLIPGRKSYFQLNVINLLNAHYFGNLSTQINAFGPGRTDPRFTPVSTRAVTGTLTMGF